VTATACSSGAYALWAAHALIASGECDAVISGSADSSLTAPTWRASARSWRCPRRATRRRLAPFDRRRNGFVMGRGRHPGAGEPRLRPAPRARVLARMPSPGSAPRVQHPLAAPEGLGMAEAMRRALDRPGSSRPDRLLNAHAPPRRRTTCARRRPSGTCSPGARPGGLRHQVDDRSLPRRGRRVEAVICCLALRDGLIPPPSTSPSRPACALDHVAGPRGPPRFAPPCPTPSPSAATTGGCPRAP